jgi:hypothetical protein
VTQPPPQDADSADSQAGAKAQGTQSIRYFWLTAGALAIITTLITVVATTHGGSDKGLGAPAAATSAANPTATDTTTGSAPSGPSTSASVGPSASSAGVPSLRRSGRIKLNTQDLSGVDLDSLDPNWSVGDITRRGVDLYFGGYISRDLSGTRGLLSATSIGPDSFRECQASTQTNVDIAEMTIKKLPLICLTTDEDRIAVFKIISYDNQQLIFDVAVWETDGG